MMALYNYFLFAWTVMEHCTTGNRSTVGALAVMPWTVAFMVIPGVAYLVRDWQFLSLCFAFPYVVMIVSFWYDHMPIVHSK